VSESQKCSVQTLPGTPNEHRIIEFASHIQIPKFNYQTAFENVLVSLARQPLIVTLISRAVKPMSSISAA